MAPNPTASKGSTPAQNLQGQGHRRARSASQPTAPGHPAAGPSSRAVDPLDFSFLDQFNAGPSSAPVYPHTEYDEDAFARALRSIQDMPPPPNPAHMPPVPPPLNPAPGQPLPNPTEAFLAALPWLQYMQMSQFGQQHQPQQNFQYLAPPTIPQQQQPYPSSGGRLRTFSESEESQMLPPTQETNPPSPDAPDSPETEPFANAEDKRRRNTAASARFRIKKKQWTLNLERTISDLSGRVEELEREASELRRENGWLKEIVMLKSKRLTGAVPELEQGTSSTQAESRSTGDRSDSSRGGSSEGGATRDGKGKGRQPP